VARPSSSGPTSQPTRTERSVRFPSATPALTPAQHYLGHSVNAPTGRWQKNKDVHWYNRDKQDTEEERNEERRHIQQLEADALAVAL
jgi:hypothetical protein